MKTRRFTVEEIRALAEVERYLDAGTIPFVRIEGVTQRIAMMPEDMERFGLVAEQTISWAVFMEIQRHMIDELTVQIECQKMPSTLSEALGEEKP